MRIILSPAKKMKTEVDTLPPTALPQFISEAEHLHAVLNRMTDTELQRLWRCNDTIAKDNIARVRSMNLHSYLTPAILSYEGIQYRYMAPNVFEQAHFEYIREHVRILSGFYGLLRPFDGIVPYRLEMQAKLPVDHFSNLYSFWSDKLATQLICETDVIVNLASQEYSRVITQYLPPSMQLVTCIFGERQGTKILEKGTMCKMARGCMVRWMAERNITAVQDLSAFQELGYVYTPKESNEQRFVFVKTP